MDRNTSEGSACLAFGGFRLDTQRRLLYANGLSEPLSFAAKVHTELYASLILSKGESAYIDSTMGHAYIAHGAGPCRIPNSGPVVHPALAASDHFSGMEIKFPSPAVAFSAKTNARGIARGSA